MFRGPDAGIKKIYSKFYVNSTPHHPAILDPHAQLNCNQYQLLNYVIASASTTTVNSISTNSVQGRKLRAKSKSEAFS
ncbi:hypothetical protein J6590_056582 [Homalodisca vitripennis]|nr:hypothetical protein J6590_056582 [Homalodisca vitripennis]